MRLLYDITPVALASPGSSRTGVYRATSELLARLAVSPSLELALTATGSPSAPAKARALFGGKLAHDPAAIDAHQEIANSSGLARAGGKIARALHPSRRPQDPSAIPPRWLEWAEVFHSSFYPLPAAVRDRGIVTLLTLYDIIPLLFPETCSADNVRLFGRIVASIDETTRIFVNSHHTAAAVEERLGIAGHRINVVPLAASTELFYPCADPARIDEVRGRLGTGPRYLLALSTLEPRKNLERLVRIFLLIAERRKGDSLRLVLAGAAGWKSEALERLLARSEGRVVATGFVPDQDLAPLYSGALAFIFPSLYEGFGLPPLEAMQCGTPVIASNRSAIPEVIGDGGLLVDPEDEGAMEEALLRLLDDQALRSALGEKGRLRASQFSWDRSAELTIAAYDAAMGEGKPIR